MARPSCITAVLAILLSLTGCISTGPSNPSFPLTVKQGRAALDQMAACGRPLERPLVIVGGYMDRHAPEVKRVLQGCTGDDRIIAVSLGAPESLADSRRLIIEAVDRAFPPSDAHSTSEVDVVGVSLGGLAARYAATPDASGRRLRIARLFTIASPHRGAVVAKNYIGSGQQLWQDLRPCSPFLARLAASDASARYALYPYARRHDGVVGESNAAPPGQTPIWVPAMPFKEGHDDVWGDPRILADIARRLRGEASYAITPSAPLPP